MATIQLTATPVEVMERDFTLKVSADEMREILVGLSSYYLQQLRYAPTSSPPEKSALHDQIVTALEWKPEDRGVIKVTVQAEQPPLIDKPKKPGWFR